MLTISYSPNLAVTSTAALPFPLAHSNKPNQAAIAGGVVGGLTLVFLLIILLVFLRKRRHSRSDTTLGSPTVKPELIHDSGLMTSQPAPTTQVSVQLLPYTDSISAVHHGNEFLPNTGRTAVLDTRSFTTLPG